MENESTPNTEQLPSDQKTDAELKKRIVRRMIHITELAEERKALAREEAELAKEMFRRRPQIPPLSRK